MQAASRRGEGYLAFHGEPPGETAGGIVEELTAFEQGVILGILMGEGHFGGDGRQAQVTLKMHVRHEPLLRWIHDRVRWSGLYGPYHHGGRHYMQLMFRGESLRRVLVPMLRQTSWPEIDPHSYERFQAMCERYGLISEEVVTPGGFS